MIEADVIFNNHDLGDSGNFSSGQNVSPQKDFHRVALHEFGHVLGLGHPDQANPKQTVSAIMNSRVSSLNHLTADDISGARSLYGMPSTPPAGPQLSNISTRARAATGNGVLIVGFILQNQAKQILLRALGRTLASQVRCRTRRSSCTTRRVSSLNPTPVGKMAKPPLPDRTGLQSRPLISIFIIWRRQTTTILLSTISSLLAITPLFLRAPPALPAMAWPRFTTLIPD